MITCRHTLDFCSTAASASVCRVFPSFPVGRAVVHSKEGSVTTPAGFGLNLLCNETFLWMCVSVCVSCSLKQTHTHTRSPTLISLCAAADEKLPAATSCIFCARATFKKIARRSVYYFLQRRQGGRPGRALGGIINTAWRSLAFKSDGIVTGASAGCSCM